MFRNILTAALLLLSSLAASAQWTIIDSISNTNYRNVYFQNVQTGVILLGDGRVVRTTDAGQNWDTVDFMQSVPGFHYCQSMEFCDPQHGFITGGSGFSQSWNFLYSTANGGQTWDSIFMNLPNVYEFIGTSFKNKDTGLVFGYNSLLRTFNGGYNTANITLPDSFWSVNDAELLPDNSIIFSTSKFSVTPVNKLFRSVNWGVNWTEVYSDATAAAASIIFIGNTGYAVTGKGAILRSSNKGISWTKTQIASDSFYFHKIRVGAQNELYIVGEKNGDGYVFGSNDGVNWVSKKVWSNDPVVDIAMPTKQAGFVISYSKIGKTTNGGNMHLDAASIAQQLDEVRIYPNPAKDILFINSPGKKINDIRLCDMSGRLVATPSFDGNKISLSNTPAGNYLIELKTEDGAIIKKLLIE